MPTAPARRADDRPGTTPYHQEEDITTRPTGLTKDAGWQVGVSRTLPIDVGAAWDYLLSPAGLAHWLGDGNFT